MPLMPKGQRFRWKHALRGSMSCCDKGEIVDHSSLIVTDANNKCWKPCLLYVTLAVDTTYLDGAMHVCDPCSGHISTENDIWMMVVMVVMPLELTEPMHLVDDGLEP